MPQSLGNTGREAVSGWHVLGAGAIGSLFACRLQDAGMHVTLLTRHDASFQRKLKIASDPPRTYHFPQQSITAGEDHGTPIEQLLVCTKAWAVADALAEITPRLGPDSTVVILCNGMGLAETALPLINGASLVLGSTTAGCRLTDDELIPAGAGRTDLGGYRAGMAAPAWITHWQISVPECRWQTDIRTILLAKVALNAVINPLTALHRVENGALLSAPLSDDTQQVIAEVQALLVASGAHHTAAELPERVRAVCEQTARNHSSMRVDLDTGRRTEIEAIVGWLLRSAGPRPPETPLLSKAYRAICDAEPSGQR